MRIKFQQSLSELKERLLVMAGLAEQAIQRSTEAYSSGDTGLCELVLLSEPSINRMEREIDQLALDLLFQLRAETGTTLMLITHDPQLAARCSRTVRIEDGRIVGQGGQGKEERA